MRRLILGVMVTTLTMLTHGAMAQTSTGTAFAAASVLEQDELPPCPGSNTTATWTNCVGEETTADGGRYVGTFREGKFHGQGALTTSDGRNYVGGFWRGKPHGRGSVNFPDGTKYVGGFWIGKYSQGTLTFPDGSTYVGEFLDNRFSRGTYTFPDGSKYVGRFRNGKRHGQGAEYSTHGAKVRSGFWENGVFVSSP